MGFIKKQKLKKYSKALEELLAEGVEKRDAAQEQINIAKKMIKEAESEGINPDRANRFLKNAESKLQGAEDIDAYDDAIKHAKAAQDIIKDLKAHYIPAKTILKSAMNRIKILETKERVTGEHRDLMKRAKAEFKNSNYEEAAVLAQRVLKLLEDS
ncbi:MAG: hypothetical protein JSV49_10390 [Thermoplasmata archaeon]|nr:MAG: hypothetical protein JSV49_10390 [Thermoplasmata archaeon]